MAAHWLTLGAALVLYLGSLATLVVARRRHARILHLARVTREVIDAKAAMGLVAAVTEVRSQLPPGEWPPMPFDPTDVRDRYTAARRALDEVTSDE